MKNNTVLYLLIFFAFTSQSCSETSPEDNNVLSGKFALQGICLNNVFTIENGSFDKDLVSDWTHPTTGVVYENAYALKNVCDLPQNLKEGDFFNFTVLKSRKATDCVVCLAFSPTPSNGLYIKFVD